MTFVLTGLDLDAKAALVRTQLEDAVGKEGLTFTVTETAGGALLNAAIHDPDPKRAGRAFSSAAVELALASYPGCTLTTPPTDATPTRSSRRRSSLNPPLGRPAERHPHRNPPPARTEPLIRELVDEHAARHAHQLPDQPQGWRGGSGLGRGIRGWTRTLVFGCDVPRTMRRSLAG
ncbi:hypothetical protein Pflav_067890 [Phytohabitans flavus]|uniref:Uncharacterized protein n=1 Tax=Phytohabitans flavus TaxID=1076124 RepID=A0A6F8Y2X3_9ACTN|nr:hypothetical protein Pflav_067890 [Phytohabitans flavus]